MIVQTWTGGLPVFVESRGVDNWGSNPADCHYALSRFVHCHHHFGCPCGFDSDCFPKQHNHLTHCFLSGPSLILKYGLDVLNRNCPVRDLSCFYSTSICEFYWIVAGNRSRSSPFKFLPTQHSWQFRFIMRCDVTCTSLSA